MKKKTKQKQSMDEKLNNLRAGVLGSNDGILTVVGVLFSVGVATTNPFTIFIAGLSDLLACAFSMAGGEYASVSSQRDTEVSAVAEEKRLLETDYAGERQDVIDYYQGRGISTATATEIADDLLKKNPLQTLVSVKYDLKIGQYMSPWSAAFSSLISAAAGGTLPLLAMTLLPGPIKWEGTIIAVIIAVALTGFLSAKLGNGLVKIAIIRNVIVGILTMFIHYFVGIMLDYFM
ncbi:VIT1/CCC1 transporter family protein [Fructilactobacillus cliffordii]|uniref:VIT family protein n=1 Tax=Fructilactobacillus cliffordii TaxID=2940299 RepID=A0A9Q8ZPK8_9LACO|nr:VIT family protein [Fructilactobacillus cliffordii]USS86160.1 VIT family protein [Fructilactobacillus cliffordii]USS89229.1 VIT family protein [Fructilactobacillus cliffordii]